MADKELVVIGGGGHAAVVAEAAWLSDWIMAGFLDDAERPAVVGWAAAIRTQGHDLQAFAPLGRLEDVGAIGVRPWIIALGDLALRRRVVHQMGLLRRDGRVGAAGTVVHPTAFVSPAAELGEGVFVGPRAVVHPGARVGAHAIVNTAAVIEHDCVIGENAHVAPGVVLGGGVRIGPDALVGLGSRVLPTLEIGRGAVVGAGAVVTRNVEAGEVVVGVPAVRIGGR